MHLCTHGHKTLIEQTHQSDCSAQTLYLDKMFVVVDCKFSFKFRDNAIAVQGRKWNIVSVNSTAVSPCIRISGSLVAANMALSLSSPAYFQSHVENIPEWSWLVDQCGLGGQMCLATSCLHYFFRLSFQTGRCGVR